MLPEACCQRRFWRYNGDSRYGVARRKRKVMSMGVIGVMGVALDPEETETSVIRELVDFTGRDVLDVGCGDGRMTWRFAASTRSLLGIDPAAESIAAARASIPDELRAKVRFEVADITTAELPAAAFDVAVFSWSLC
jgi:ubiquinone/menaquinone biosynthesis C-methylase UbiE